MFTGIIEDVGQVVRLGPRPKDGGAEGALRDGVRVTIGAPLLEEEQALGASLAVDGVCLTVVAWRRGEVDVEVGPETLSCTTLCELEAHARVNLERPMRLGDRLGGHIVAGHVDGVGNIASATARGGAVDLVIAASPSLLRYVIAKGSITVDGISLTVNLVDAETFSVSLIPHTQAATTLAQKGAGRGVNLEVDLIGKYVEKLVGAYKS